MSVLTFDPPLGPHELHRLKNFFRAKENFDPPPSPAALIISILNLRTRVGVLKLALYGIYIFI